MRLFVASSMSGCFAPCRGFAGIFVCAYQVTPWSISTPNRSSPSGISVLLQARCASCHPVSIFGAAVGPAHLALSCLPEQPDNSWFVGSSEPTTARTDATSTVCALASKKPNVPKNQAALDFTRAISLSPRRLLRLLLVLAILYLTSLGVSLEMADKRALSWTRIGNAV